MVLDTPKHYPVLLNELISIISPQHGGTFIDCTFGQGGYTQKILSYKNTNVIALDRDIESKIIADRILDNFKDRFIFKNKRFSKLSDLKLKNENINQINDQYHEELLKNQQAESLVENTGKDEESSFTHEAIGESTQENEIKNDLKEFGVDKDSPDLFSSENETSSLENMLSQENEDQEDDLEIPAFLRRQKN